MTDIQQHTDKSARPSLTHACMHACSEKFNQRWSSYRVSFKDERVGDAFDNVSPEAKDFITVGG
jgi:uncharacterized protein (DUF736 family)